AALAALSRLLISLWGSRAPAIAAASVAVLSDWLTLTARAYSTARPAAIMTGTSDIPKTRAMPPPLQLPRPDNCSQHEDDDTSYSPQRRPAEEEAGSAGARGI